MLSLVQVATSTCTISSSRSDTRSFPKEQIINSITREGIEQSKLDMNALDTTKILSTTTKGVHVYDVRNLNKRIFTQENHTDRTTQSLWSPHRELVFASSSRDRHVCITDMSEVDRHSMNDAVSIQQSVIVTFLYQFNHEGHKKEVRNFDWNKSENFMFVSNDEDSINIWKLVARSNPDR